LEPKKTFLFYFIFIYFFPACGIFVWVCELNLITSNEYRDLIYIKINFKSITCKYLKPNKINLKKNTYKNTTKKYPQTMYTAHMPAAGSSQVAFHSPASRSRGINQCTFELFLKN
jgi:hypothetical protein